MIIGYRRILGKEPLMQDAGCRNLHPVSIKKGAEKTPPLIRYA
jgi:hypothetical protein